MMFNRWPDICFCEGEEGIGDTAGGGRLSHSVRSRMESGEHVEEEGEDSDLCPFAIPTILSYDCNCQYSVYLLHRFQRQYPEHAKRIQHLRFTIPVLHIRGHKERCEYQFGSYYMKGAGHFYGEQAESPWAEFNQLGARTRQMAPGYRQDVLNQHYGDWNWKKVTTMCT